MKKYCLMAIAYLALFSTYVTATEGLYVKSSGGANWLDCGDDNRAIGYVATGSVGYKFCNGFSLEGEFDYHQNKNKFSDEYLIGESNENEFTTLHFTQKLSTEAYLVHVLYDLPFNYQGIKPYVGWGVGYARQTLHIKCTDYPGTNSFRKNGFAWDILGGVSYPICDALEIDLEARYLNTRWKADNISVCAGLKFYLY